jgi:large subunit ribosomal protein L18
MAKKPDKKLKRTRRQKKIRAKISGTAQCPRLSVFKSNKHIQAQLINDQAAKTILSANDAKMKKTSLKNGEETLEAKQALAYKVGKEIAEEAVKKGIKKAVFDRGGYKYHGRVKSLAEGARAGGLNF